MIQNNSNELKQGLIETHKSQVHSSKRSSASENNSSTIEWQKGTNDSGIWWNDPESNGTTESDCEES